MSDSTSQPSPDPTDDGAARDRELTAGARAAAESERDRASAARTESEAERDKASTANTAAESARAQADAARIAAESSRDQASTANTEAKAQRDRARAANTAAESARDQAVAAKAAAELARDQAIDAKTAAEGERDKASTAKTIAESERDQATVAKTAAEEERDKASAAKTATEAERDKASAAKTEAEAERDKATAAKATAEEARSKAIAAKDKAEDEQKKAAAASGAAEQERKKAVTSRETVDQEIERARAAHNLSTTIGLAGAFNLKAKAAKSREYIWIVVLVGALAAAFAIGASRYSDLTSMLARDAKVESLVAFAVVSAFGVAPFIWLAWMGTRMIGKNFALTEDYAYKAALAQAYVGFRDEAKKLDPIFEQRLFAAAVTHLDANPVRFVHADHPGSPLQDLLQQPFMAEVLKNDSFKQQLVDWLKRRFDWNLTTKPDSAVVAADNGKKT